MPKNPQLAATRNRQAAPERLLQTNSTFSKSVMVSMHGVSKLGPMDPIFIDARVKINDAYYHEDVLLTQKLYCLSWVRSVASSLSSSKAMYLLIERVGQSTF